MEWRFIFYSLELGDKGLEFRLDVPGKVKNGSYWLVLWIGVRSMDEGSNPRGRVNTGIDFC